MNASRLEKLVRNVVRKIYFKYPSCEWEDLESQAWLIVAENIEKYKEGKGTTLTTFLHERVYHCLQTYVQRVHLKELNMNGHRVHNDYELDYHSYSSEEAMDARITIQKMIEKEEGVPRDILLLMLEGYSQSEIAEKTGTSRQNISQILNRMRERYS